MNICWHNSDSALLLNPRYPKSEKKRLQAILKATQRWKGHIWISTSGSLSPKWVGLSKAAILASADAVNQHLESSKEDQWVNALPYFHVGGLALFARAHLTEAKVHDFTEHFSKKWNPEEFFDYIQRVKGTLTALVPTQLYDLILTKKKAPPTLRALIIGGGALLPDLYERGIALGWPILPSYGLTECASQVATAPLHSWKENRFPSLHLLPHLEANLHNDRLAFAGASLLSAYAYLEDEKIHIVDPKSNGRLITEDRGVVEEGKLIPLGRSDSIVKVVGENVDIARLENHLQTLRLRMGIQAEVTLVVLPDERLSHKIVCVLTSSNCENIGSLIEEFQATVLPFERIREVSLIPAIPRSAIGKIQKQELIHLVMASRIA